MAVTATTSIYYTYMKSRKEINLLADDIRAALMDENFVFDRDKHRVWTAPYWSGETSYISGELLIPTSPNGYVYAATADGISGSGEPDSWPTTFGSTTKDSNDLEYMCWSYETACNEISSSGEYSNLQLTLSGEDAGQYLDETNGLSYVHFDNIRFEASGESFEETFGSVIFDNTAKNKPVMVGIGFDTSYTITAGNHLELQEPQFEDETKQTTI